MDTKGIDLTQCINCRFRTVVDGKEVTGRIEKPKTNLLLTGDDWFGCAVTPAELDNLLRGAGLTVEDEGSYISGFEIVPRDPETYQDWQVGDVIWDTHESGDSGKVIFRNGEFVAAEIIGMCRCYTCQELFKDGYRLVLTDIEKRIIEDIQKSYEFKKGEPVLVRDVPEGKWLLSAFVRYNQIDYRPFCASNGTDPIHFLYCLPYNERTMHLLGSNEDYKEEQR